MIGLRELAHSDMLQIMNDESGFRWPCVVTSPDLSSASLFCRSTDIHLSIDPGTGEVITGRQASVSFALDDLKKKGMQSIRGIEDSTSKPWTVTTKNINEVEQVFKVVQTYPDNTLGLVVCFLEAYE